MHDQQEDKPDYWFPAKRYGWGWGPPVRWQGWVVLVAYLICLLAGGPLIHRRNPIASLLFALAMTAALILVCWWKGEKPRWRWGGK